MNTALPPVRCETCNGPFWPLGPQKRCRVCRFAYTPPAAEYTRAERRKGDSDKDAQTTAPVVLPKANAAEAESPAPEIGPAPAFFHQCLPSERRKPMTVTAARERAERDERLAAMRAAQSAKQRRFMGLLA